MSQNGTRSRASRMLCSRAATCSGSMARGPETELGKALQAHERIVIKPPLHPGTTARSCGSRRGAGCIYRPNDPGCQGTLRPSRVSGPYRWATRQRGRARGRDPGRSSPMCVRRYARAPKRARRPPTHAAGSAAENLVQRGHGAPLSHVMRRVHHGWPDATSACAAIETKDVIAPNRPLAAISASPER